MILVRTDGIAEGDVYLPDWILTFFQLFGNVPEVNEWELEGFRENRSKFRGEVGNVVRAKGGIVNIIGTLKGTNIGLNVNVGKAVGGRQLLGCREGRGGTKGMLA